MKITQILPALLAVSVLAAFPAHADDRDDGRNKAECPLDAVLSMDVEFGTGTADITTCITKRKHVRAVVNISSADLHKSGASQQVVNVVNMYNNYEQIYGMQSGKDFDLRVVAHGKGGRWLLSDEAYNRIFGVTTGNPSRSRLQDAMNHGVKVYMCQNTLRGNGWKTADLIPGVEETPAGVTALVDFGEQGYVVVTP